MKNQNLKELDNMKVITRRFQLITVARYREKSKMKRAMEVQDELREKSKGWDSTKEIRKWRDTRYGPSST